MSWQYSPIKSGGPRCEMNTDDEIKVPIRKGFQSNQPANVRLFLDLAGEINHLNLFLFKSK